MPRASRQNPLPSRYEGIGHDEAGHARPAARPDRRFRSRQTRYRTRFDGRPLWLSPARGSRGARRAAAPKGRSCCPGDGDQGFTCAIRSPLRRIASRHRSRLPSLGDQSANLQAQAIGTTDPAALEALAKQNGADQALTGTLEWSDAARGWIAEWRLAFAGQNYAWRVRGVSFDDAFRNALRGAAQVRSGNGQPDS